MSGLMKKLFPKAQAADATLVLPEGQDPRVMQAAQIITENKIAKVIILATPEEAAQSMKGVTLNGDAQIVNWLESPEAPKLAAVLLERRKKKGMTEEQSLEMVKKRLYFANLMLNQGMVDGLVAGSISSTADMLRSAFHCVGTAKGIKMASSCFLMDLKQPTAGGEESLIFADCGVNPDPDAEGLVDIAIATIKTHQALMT